MTHLEEIESPGQQELIFPCECRGAHYLRITWVDDDPDFRYVWIDDVYKPDSLLDRIKSAFTMLRGKERCTQSVVLDDECADNLKTFFNSR